jgi:aspartate/methionine/tyrosine aminotransferase
VKEFEVLTKMNLANRVIDAFQLDYRDRGLLAPLEALGAVYPRYGQSFRLPEDADREETHIDDIDIGIGSYFPTPPAVVEACIRALQAGYTQYLDLAELKEAIVAKLATENSMTVEPDQILLTGGARTGMIMSTLALVNPGDVVLIPDPDYMGLGDCARIAGAELVRVPMAKVGGAFRFDPQRMIDSAKPRTKAIMFCNPNNPTGYLYSLSDLEAIADLAERRNLFVITNELYDRLVFDGGGHTSLASFPGMMERTVTIQGLTKIYDMSGLRIGWMVASKNLIRVMTDLRMLACQALPPSISQFGGVAALTNPTRDEHVREVLKLYYRIRDMTVEALDGYHGVSCPKPMAGHFAFADFGVFGTDDVKTALFLKHEARVLTVPGSVWGFCGRGHLRLALANPPDVQEEGLTRLRKGIELLAQ